MPQSASAPPPVTLSIDASSTVGPRTGIGIATAHLLDALCDELPEQWKLKVWVNSARHPIPSEDKWASHPRIQVRRTRLPGRGLLRSWQWLRLPPVEAFVGKTQLHHSPASYLTPSLGARSVVTVHDLYFLKDRRDRDKYGGDYFASTFPGRLRRVDRIIVPSEATRSDLIEAYDILPERICVIPWGVDRKLFHPEPSADDEATVEAFDCSEPFMLCVASIGPRKNLVGLVEAYAEAKKSEPGLANLVIAGRVDSSETEHELKESIARLELGSKVKLVGYLQYSELASFYRRARATVIPSLGEGFGLPVVEAMASGCPVVATRAGSLQEVAGEAALLVDTGNETALAKAIVQISSDDTVAESLKARGLEHARKYDWNQTARATIQVYRDALEVH